MQTVLITGCNRGIGLELAKQYQENGHKVIAFCRNSSPELNALSPSQLIESVDVSDLDSIQQAFQQLASNTTIDILINNAGIMARAPLHNLSPTTITAIEHQFKTNALGPLMITSLALPYLSSGSKVILMTSRMGSIDDNSSGGQYGYRMSKSALNSAGKSLAIDLRENGIPVGIIHPGWIQTDMTNHTGNDTPKTAASQIRERIHEISLENTGTFWHANGQKLPW